MSATGGLRTAQQLADYKRPHQYRFVDALPRTRNGKLQRRLLAERMLAGTGDR